MAVKTAVYHDTLLFLPRVFLTIYELAGGSQFLDFTKDNKSPWKGIKYDGANAPWNSDEWPDRDYKACPAGALQDDDYFKVMFDTSQVKDTK